ncbi:MAG TPA: DUF5668 domain-containing protein [Terriglobales bacterium]|nr:DUF5668 domain-containing protein [Terriglobales bacterium]
MSDRVRCRCQSCTIDSFMGPAIITTIGVLFLLAQMQGGYFSFGHTWPVILLVIGLIKLASAIAPRTGHVSDSLASPNPPPAQAPQAPTPPQQGQGQ